MEEKDPKKIFSNMVGLTLLFFVCASFIDRRLFRLPIQLGGFSLLIAVEMFDLMTLFLALFTGLGVFAVLRDGFPLTRGELSLRAFLPFSSTLIMGVSLKNAGGGMAWWLILFFGGLLLWAVLLSEYFICDRESAWRPAAVILLTALSGAVFLLGVIAIRANVMRLVLELPMVFFIAYTASRSRFSLWVREPDTRVYSFVTGAVMTLTAMGAHYLPINAISYGILFFIWYDMLVNIEVMLLADRSLRNAFLRQIPMLMVLSGLFVISLM